MSLRYFMRMTDTRTRPTFAKRKPVNLSLSQDMVKEAKAAGIAALNKFIDEESFPLAHLRLW
jgi:post-segregation antitoxin (ccd killing protein)